MRILHVVPTYIPAWRYGGPIHSVHGLCKALAGRGIEVHVATTNVNGDVDSDVSLTDAVDIDGVMIHYFRSTKLRRLYYSQTMYQFMLNSTHRWDLIHTHSTFLWPTTAAAHLARRSRKPYIVSPRGMLVRELIERRSTAVKKAWIQLFERRNIERAAAVHVTSELEGKDVLQLGLRPQRLLNIPNGIEIPVRQNGFKSLSGIQLPESYALFLGRISWKKGLDRLLAAVARAPGLNLVVAGNDDEGYLPSMLSLATDLGISDRTFFIGFIEGDAKWHVLSKARTLVLPSYSENFGNVVLEAMAMGVPVVVTPEVGISAEIARSESGIVVEGTPESIAAAMTKLLSDDALRATLGQRGRTAAQALSWQSVAMQMEEAYRDVLRSPLSMNKP